MHETYRRVRTRVLREVAARAHGDAAVSLCCGRGAELLALRRALGPGVPLVGVDKDPDALRDAGRRLRVAELGDVRLVLTDVATYRPGGASFACCCFGLGYLPAPVRVLRAWVDALAPGGRLVVADWPHALPWDELLAWPGTVATSITDGDVTVRVAQLTKAAS